MSIVSHPLARGYVPLFLIVAAVLILLTGIYLHTVQALLPIASMLVALRIFLQSDDSNVQRFSGVLTFGFAMSTLSNIAWYLVPTLFDYDLILSDNYYYVTGMFWIVGYAAIAYVLLQLKNSRQWYLERRLDRAITAIGALAISAIGLFVLVNIDWYATFNDWERSHIIDIGILLVYLVLDVLILTVIVKLLAMNVKIELRYLLSATLLYFTFNMAGDFLFECRWLFQLSRLVTLHIGSFQTTLTIREATNDIYNVSLMVMTVLLIIFTLDLLRSVKIDEIRGRLRDTQLFVDDLIAKSPEATCIFDRDGRLVLVNDPFLQIFGLKRNDVDLSFNIFSHISEKISLNDEYAGILKVRNNETVIIPRLKLQNIPGGRQGDFYLYTKMFPTYGSDGRVSNYVLIIEDITARIGMEIALRQSEEKFRMLAETSPAAIIIYQGESIVYVNPAAEKMTGYKLEEFLTMKPWDFIHPDYQRQIKEKAALHKQGIPLAEHYDTKIVTKDGRELWTSNSTTTVTYLNRPAGLIIAIDITERKRLEEDLLEAYRHLKEAYERKIDFTNTVAHELRTPLTPIIGYTDILKSEVQDERHLQFLEIIERNALRQKTLVDRMLELASLDAGMAHVNCSEFALKPLVMEIADNYRAVNPHIRVEVPEGMRINTDPGILRHVVDNLVSNAVKYSDNDREVEIRVSLTGDGYLFSVKDCGTGIPKEEWDKIFERFYIVGGDSDSRASGRSGLGLTLVKAYVRLIGGNVWLESEPGKGSTFFFTVPLNPTAGSHDR